MKSHENRHLAELRKRIAKVPTGSGVYRWMNEKGEVLYIGKAKNLHERMRGYVAAKADASAGPWKLSLREKIADFDVTTTTNEVEALVLETNLIKNLKPKYNVLMKDDKNYVYVRISTQDPCPTISILRRVEDDGATYFGPFFTSYKTEQILKNLDMVWHFRACKRSLERLNAAHPKGSGPLPPARHPKGPDPKPTPCLEYQIGRCNGLCISAVSEEEHRRRIEEVIRFFRGDHTSAVRSIEEAMQRAVSEQKFEAAARFRDALLFMEALQEKQVVSDTSGANTDAIGIALRGSRAQVVILRERGGRVIDELSFALAGEAASSTEALTQFLPQYYTDTPDIPEEILVSEEPEGLAVLEAWLREKRGKRVAIVTPERGKKSKLLTMAERNAAEKIEQQYAKWEAAAKNTETALRELQELLALPHPPRRIEGYDISHLGGTETVGAMVVFKNGKSANEEYRSFTLRTVKEGEIDDYKALREVLRRRLLHLIRNVKEEEKAWKENGITFGKARMKEQNCIEKVHAEHPEKMAAVAIRYREYLVGRRGDDIIAFGRMFKHPSGLIELKSIWVENEWRGHKLGAFIVRKLLQGVKRGKIYVTIVPSLENYYAELGFRHLINPPKVLVEEMEEEKRKFPKTPMGIAMVWDAKQNKPDQSLSARPDLLLIDGGIGQLHVAVNVLRELRLEIPVVALAKREELVYAHRWGQDPSHPTAHPKGPDPVQPQAHFLLQRIRDEAHRRCHEHREKRAIKSLRSSAS